MTKRLIIMRHAKSSWEAPVLDHERPLNSRGASSAEAIGRWLRSFGYVPDEILCSTSRRTMQTCERLNFQQTPQLLRALYLASPEQLLQRAQYGQGSCLLVIAHNPGIAGFARQISKTAPDHPCFQNYPTGATTVMNCDIRNWSDLRPASGDVIAFKIPRELT